MNLIFFFLYCPNTRLIFTNFRASSVIDKVLYQIQQIKIFFNNDWLKFLLSKLMRPNLLYLKIDLVSHFAREWQQARLFPSYYDAIISVNTVSLRYFRKYCVIGPRILVTFKNLQPCDCEWGWLDFAFLYFKGQKSQFYLSITQNNLPKKPLFRKY